MAKGVTVWTGHLQLRARELLCFGPELTGLKSYPDILSITAACHEKKHILLRLHNIFYSIYAIYFDVK
jgi:hypothetical protein